MAVTRWTLYNPRTDVTLTLAMNPKQVVGLDGVDAPLNFMQPAGEDSEPIFYGRPAKPIEISASGTILTLQALDDMIEWAGKRNALKLTTDLGRRYWVRFDKFTPTRVNVVNREYKASFDLHGWNMGRIVGDD